MITDLDTRITSALRDTADTTEFAPDPLATIIRRGKHRAQNRRRMTIIGTAATGVALCTGTAYAVVDHLSPEQSASVEQHPTCGLSAETARLVATAEEYGRAVDYWTVDGDGRFGDFLFERDGMGGGGGCAGQSRHEAHPHLPWANYLLETGHGTGLFSVYGQAPPGTAIVEIVMSTGTIRTTPAEDGFYVALAQLPYNNDDRLVRVKALSSDGTVVATGRY